MEGGKTRKLKKKNKIRKNKTKKEKIRKKKENQHEKKLWWKHEKIITTNRE